MNFSCLYTDSSSDTITIGNQANSLSTEYVNIWDIKLIKGASVNLLTPGVFPYKNGCLFYSGTENNNICLYSECDANSKY